MTVQEVFKEAGYEQIYKLLEYCYSQYPYAFNREGGIPWGTKRVESYLLPLQEVFSKLIFYRLCRPLEPGMSPDFYKSNDTQAYRFMLDISTGIERKLCMNEMIELFMRAEKQPLTEYTQKHISVLKNVFFRNSSSSLTKSKLLLLIAHQKGL